MVMTTNFYLKLPITPETDDGLHIGLAAFGWRFLFKAHPEQNLRTFKQWCDMLATGKIVNEVEEEFTLDEFKAFVARKMTSATHLHWWEEVGAAIDRRDTRYVDEDGYSFDAREFS